MKPEEFEEIYKKYFDTLYRISFLYMKNDADALDVVQDVFVKVLSGKVTFLGEEQLKAWLLVTASNSCKSKLKRWWNKKRSEYTDECQNWVNSQAAPECSEVLEEVMALEDKYRIPVYLHYYEGYSTIEIGQMLNISPSTIQTRLAKARKLLRLSLSEGEICTEF